MRPSRLDPLFAPARSLPGVGPRVETLLKRLFGEADADCLVRDLLLHFPAGFIERQPVRTIAELPAEGVVTLTLMVERHDIPPRGSRAPWRVTVADDTGSMQLVYFNPRADWLKKALPVGEKRVISGRLEWYDYRAQIVHPDYIVAPQRADEIPGLDPVYGLTAGLSARVLRKIINAALERLPELPEWQDTSVLSERKWPSFIKALKQIHQPDDPRAASPVAAAWQRLAYDEFLASQLSLALVRRSLTRAAGEQRTFTGALREKIMAALPYSLTASQQRAVGEIEADLASPDRMLRLLQGDVGSGKTVIALLAMAAVAESGAQAALMAPTEILARQHYAVIAPLAEAAGLSVALLTGKDRKSDRADAEKAIADGKIQLVIGTHALFQSSVEFDDLGLVVVDEQHRFGVHQRLALSAKGRAPDILVMTATPIPRTLVLTFYGDMDISQLREKPAGRQPIDTRIVSQDRLGEVVSYISAAVGKGEKAYWVCPLVSESDVLDVTAAEERYGALSQTLGQRVGLVHGRMTPAQKDNVMAHFRAGDIAVLVATTVIEVGVDVPDATIMVIEQAERFGLAQLHQLRGRVGRSDRPSHCLLMYKPPLGETARARLTIMRETNDGFAIAEEDLRLRGEGDVMGVRQSGVPGFRIALPELHGELLQMARDEAQLILARDADFKSRRAEALRHLLYLFGRDDAVRLMRAG
ncbi:MAG: ATP-dependent DNA helicase RecG [Hyphomicrobiales bacterium]|nr:ATP-dependent DNA helicase RecG [Hyphomicrobiales bacterium]